MGKAREFTVGSMVFIGGLAVFAYMPAVAALTSGLTLQYSLPDCANAQQLIAMEDTISELLIFGGILTGVGFISCIFLIGFTAPFLLAAPMIGVGLLVNAIIRSQKCENMSEKEEERQLYYYIAGIAIPIVLGALVFYIFKEYSDEIRFGFEFFD